VLKSQLGIPNKAVVIGNVAVFRFQKRLDLWLKALKEVSESQPNVYGLLVGAGPMENDVKETINQLGLQNRVILAGLQKEVKPYYQLMDIFMMSSSFEGLPIALLEAMSMSCAVVSTQAGGIKEVIRHQIDGLTCSVDNWEQLSPLCELLIENPDKLSNFQQAARVRVTEMFSLTKMVHSLETLYKGII
jgi:glycosyltransferase involved in cell wall biosynthesis